MINIEWATRRLAAVNSNRSYMEWGQDYIKETVEKYNSHREEAGLPRLSEEEAITKILLYMPEGFQLNGTTGRGARIEYSDPEVPKESKVNLAGIFAMCALYKILDGGRDAQTNAAAVLHYINGIRSYVPPEEWYVQDYESDP